MCQWLPHIIDNRVPTITPHLMALPLVEDEQQVFERAREVVGVAMRRGRAASSFAEAPTTVQRGARPQQSLRGLLTIHAAAARLRYSRIVLGTTPSSRVIYPMLAPALKRIESNCLMRRMDSLCVGIPPLRRLR